jgi:hypothetical protein
VARSANDGAHDGIAVLTVMRGEIDLLPAMLASVAWAGERHVVETGPDPQRTRAIAASAVVHHHPLPPGASFEDARAAALDHIAARWILVLDTDERVPPTLADTLQNRAAEWTHDDIDGVWIARRNYVLDSALNHSSGWPDYQLRFLRRAAVAFSPILHHAIRVDGTTVRLDAEPALAIEHRAFRSTDQYIDKINLYTGIEAAQAETFARATPGRAVFAAGRDFLARYVHMQGFRDGRAGLHYAICMSIYRYLALAKQWERGLIQASVPARGTRRSALRRRPER